MTSVVAKCVGSIAVAALIAAGPTTGFAQNPPARDAAPASAAAATASAALRQVDLFTAGQDGYHTYRIPSVIVTPKGTVLAFAEGRRASANDAGNIDLVAKRSTDGARSWSPMRTVLADETHRFGDPCPVIDRTRGTIWLLFTRSLAVDNEKAIIAGTSKGARTVWAVKSVDDGVSWSTPVEITPQVKRANWTWYATGPGVGIQTRTGRLVIPANHAEAGSELHRSHLFYSDDGGSTWTLGAEAEAGTNESQVVELADGRLMLNMRNHPPKPENYRMVARSTDGGRTLTASSPDRTLIEPPAQASILRLSLADADSPNARNTNSGNAKTRATNAGAANALGLGRSPERNPGVRNRLLFSNPASAKRERLTVRVSYDEGETWPESAVIHAGPAAYSSLAVLPDRTIGLLYERGDRSAYERITFATFTLDWLTGGRDRLESPK